MAERADLIRQHLLPPGHTFLPRADLAQTVGLTPSQVSVVIRWVKENHYYDPCSILSRSDRGYYLSMEGMGGQDQRDDQARHRVLQLLTQARVLFQDTARPFARDTADVGFMDEIEASWNDLLARIGARYDQIAREAALVRRRAEVEQREAAVDQFSLQLAAMYSELGQPVPVGLQEIVSAQEEYATVPGVPVPPS